jgi:hypothetical protein
LDAKIKNSPLIFKCPARSKFLFQKKLPNCIQAIARDVICGPVEISKRRFQVVDLVGMGSNTANGLGKDVSDAGQGIQNGAK